MKQQLELALYESPRTQQRQVVYHVGDLEKLSATALYYGTSGGGFSGGGHGGISKGDIAKFGIVATPLMETTPIGSGNSGFVPASNFGLGPGIAKKTKFDFIERYRAPDVDDANGEHINLESYLPGKTKPFLNIHIDLNDD